MQAQAIPKSTIVLAVLTCIPFGLAIRDVAIGRNMTRAEAIEAYHRLDRDPDVEEEDYRDVAKRRAIEELEQRMEIEKKRAEERAQVEQSKAALRTLFDAEVATHGRAFASIRLGEPITVRPAPGDGYSAMLIDNGAVAHTLWIDLADRYCTTLPRELDETWGSGRRHEGTVVWFNEKAGRRAVFFNPGGCTLKFEKVAPLASWLDKSPSSIVPLWAVGQPVAKLKTALGAKAPKEEGEREVSLADPRASLVEGQLTWTDYGLAGAGRGPTQLTAYSEAGRVTGVLAAFTADSETLDQLIERISQLTGKQPQDDAPVWKSNPPIELQTGDQIFLRVGKQPK